MVGLKAGPIRGKLTPVSIEARWQFALAEDDRRLVVIVAHLGIAGRREGNNPELAQGQPLRGAKRTRCRFAGDRSVGFQVSSPAGIECLNEVACFASHGALL